MIIYPKPTRKPGIAQEREDRRQRRIAAKRKTLARLGPYLNLYLRGAVVWRPKELRGAP